MSNKALTWAFSQKIDSPLKKFVLVALADAADPCGFCWLHYSTIADQCDMGRRTVIKYVKELVEDGLLNKTVRKKAGHFLSNVYQLNIGEPVPEDHPLKEYDLGSAQDALGGAQDALGGAQDALIKEPLLNPHLNKERERTLTREEFLRGIDKEYQAEAFKGEFGHLSETEIKAHAEECYERWKENLIGRDFAIMLKSWLRKGQQLGAVRKPTKEKAFKEAKPEIKSADLPEWKRSLLNKVDEKTYRAWFENLEYSEGTLYAPSKFHRDYLLTHYEYIINTALGFTQIAVKEPEYA